MKLLTEGPPHNAMAYRKGVVLVEMGLGGNVRVRDAALLFRATRRNGQRSWLLIAHASS